MSNRNQIDVVVVGGANMDFLVRGPALPQPGETVMGNEFQQAPGGKGANQAVAVSRLGASAALVARVGDDQHGRSIIKRLQKEGIDTEYVTTDAKALTGAALIMVEEQGEKEILTAPGANQNFSTEQVRDCAELIQSASVLMTQLAIPLEAALLTVRLAHQAGATTVLDPSPATPLPDELLQMVSVIKPNATEAETLTGMRVMNRSSARTAAKQLLDRGVGAVAIQAGQEGNLIATSEDEYWFPLLSVESIDATGAGDAFAAALAVGLHEKLPWATVGAWASASAAFSTTRLGAQAGLPTRDQVVELLTEQGFTT